MSKQDITPVSYDKQGYSGNKSRELTTGRKCVGVENIILWQEIHSWNTISTEQVVSLEKPAVCAEGALGIGPGGQWLRVKKWVWSASSKKC